MQGLRWCSTNLSNTSEKSLQDKIRSIALFGQCYVPTGHSNVCRLLKHLSEVTILIDQTNLHILTISDTCVTETVLDNEVYINVQLLMINSQNDDDQASLLINAHIIESTSDTELTSTNMLYLVNTLVNQGSKKTLSGHPGRVDFPLRKVTFSPHLHHGQEPRQAVRQLNFDNNFEQKG